MTTTYPTTIDAFTTRLAGDRVRASHFNDPQDAVVAVETRMGASLEYINPLPNPVLNGDLLVWQDGTTFTSIAHGAYGPDMWRYLKSGTVVHDLSRSTDVPTVNHNYSMLLDVTTADTSMAAGDHSGIYQPIEGYNFLKTAQKEFTVGFWVKAPLAGAYCVSFRNSGLNRSYVKEYIVNVADTWEWKTMTIPASPSTGTWDYTTGIGLWLGFTLAAGNNFRTTPDGWRTGNYTSTQSQVNAVASTAYNFRIAGVTIVPGPYALPLPEQPTTRTECLRYREILGGQALLEHFCSGFEYTALGRDSANTILKYYPKRIVPTSFGVSAVSDFEVVQPAGVADTQGVAWFDASLDRVYAEWDFTIAGTAVNGNACLVRANDTLDARIKVIATL